MKRKIIIPALLGSALLFSCSSDKSDSLDSEIENSVVDDGNENNNNQTEINEEEANMINNLVSAMPSPLETAIAIRSAGEDFNSQILNSPENIDNYTTESKKALNIGVFGTDLGYINIYEKQLFTVSYVAALQGLAENIKVGQFFNLKAIEKMASQKDNMDSLIQVTTKNYNEMDQYLREQNRGKLSAFMAIGTWVEGLHILGEVYNSSKNDALREKIAEQQVVIEILMEIAKFYKNDNDVKEVVAGLDELNTLYGKVELEVIEGEPVMQEVDGELVVVDTGSTTYTVDDATLETILAKTNEIRSLIIN